MTAEELAVLAATNRLGGKSELGKEWQHVGDHEQLLRRGSSFKHLVGVLRLQSDAFLYKRMLAGLDRRDGGLRVQLRRVADIDHVDVRIGKQLVEPVVFL